MKRLSRAFPRSAFGVAALSSLLAMSLVLGSTVPVQPQYAIAPPEVNTLPGVTFVLQYVNLTFANGVAAQNVIKYTGGQSSCLTIDTYQLCGWKQPATYPSATINVTAWSPDATSGQLMLFGVGAPLNAKVNLNVSGIVGGATVSVLHSNAAFTTVVTNATGFATWSWTATNADPGGTFELDIVQGGGGGGGNGPGAPIILIRPAFVWRTAFDFFNASSDEYVYFADTSTVPNGLNRSYLWRFGDGNSSSGPNPVHHYVFGFSASFTVRETVCAGSSCNITTQTVTLVRSHAMIVVIALGVIFAVSVAAVWKLGQAVGGGKKTRITARLRRL